MIKTLYNSASNGCTHSSEEGNSFVESSSYWHSNPRKALIIEEDHIIIVLYMAWNCFY